MRRPIRFPTVVGIVLVIALVAAVSFFFEKLSRGLTTATGSVKPERVTVSNISDSSFTVSWTTNLDATGTVIISTDTWKSTVFYDERDVHPANDDTKRTLGSYAMHYVNVRNLSPDTKHDIRILSNGKSFSGVGPATTIRTAPNIGESTSQLEPAYGTILTSGNESANGAIVYLSLEGGQMLSALTNAKGSWLIPLNLARSQDLTAFVPATVRTTETILVRYGDEETTATSDTLNDAPLPTMVMGKTYDFREQQAEAPNSSSLAYSNQDQVSKFPEVQGVTTKVQGQGPYHVTLTQPEDGASLPTFLPLITGTGVPDTSVVITLGITQPFTGSTRVGDDGLWRYTPSKTLPPGKQSVTITAVDATGIPVALTHTFEILKSGTQVLGEATPSATLTPTPPTGAPSPTPLFSPTIGTTPTVSLAPTSTLSGSPLPQSGNVLPLFVAVLFATVLLSTGVLLTLKL